MCKCTPTKRTPWCGKPGCEMPVQASTPTTSSTDDELREKIANIVRDEDNYGYAGTRPINQIMALIRQDREALAKAYGGCTNCYGKGYATVNDRWIGPDTDTDIGSPGGYIKGGNANAMKFCKCDRGKQLKQLIGEDREARERTTLETVAAMTGGGSSAQEALDTIKFYAHNKLFAINNPIPDSKAKA